MVRGQIDADGLGITPGEGHEVLPPPLLVVIRQFNTGIEAVDPVQEVLGEDELLQMILRVHVIGVPLEELVMIIEDIPVHDGLGVESRTPGHGLGPCHVLGRESIWTPPLHDAMDTGEVGVVPSRLRGRR